uniref:Uncharacterized protein n=1 Tax=Glossina palpalis gambiensis TaxID=67801 RepID=A0A1B0B1H4_9MUSC
MEGSPEGFVYLPLTKFQIKIEKLTKTLKLESHPILELYNNVELIRPSTRNGSKVTPVPKKNH